jgi:hypothetical protein
MTKSDKLAKAAPAPAPAQPGATVIDTTNSVGYLIALLLNQEGWTKSVDDLICAGDLLNSGLPGEKPADNPTWDDQPLEISLTAKQLKAVKNCVNVVADKGSLIPGSNVLALLGALDYPVPDTKDSVTLKLPQVAAKYLGDILGTPERTKGTTDLVTASQVINRLPKFDQSLTDKGRESSLQSWMDEPVEISITERQRDLCRAALKKAAEEGRIKTSKYTPILYTELGLRE